MGCRCSSPTREGIPLQFGTGSPVASTISIIRGKPKPLQPLSTGTLSTPEMFQKRITFWDTQPSYSGRKEVWQALRLAVEADSLETCQAILDSCNIIVPSGKFTDGCYDSWGNHYVIPEYCLGQMDTFEMASRKSMQLLENEEVHVDESHLFSVTVRTSTGVDVVIRVAPHFTILKLIQLVAEHQNWSREITNSCIVVLFGKKLHCTTKISETLIDGSQMVQIMVL